MNRNAKFLIIPLLATLIIIGADLTSKKKENYFEVDNGKVIIGLSSNE